METSQRQTYNTREISLIFGEKKGASMDREDYESSDAYRQLKMAHRVDQSGNKIPFILPY